VDVCYLLSIKYNNNNNVVLAAKYDIDAVAEACDADKVFSGGTSVQHKAAKLHFRQREDAAKWAQEELNRLQGRRCLQANAITTAAGPQPPLPPRLLLLPLAGQFFRVLSTPPRCGYPGPSPRLESCG
jgi:hypothetical protein